LFAQAAVFPQFAVYSLYHSVCAIKPLIVLTVTERTSGVSRMRVPPSIKSSLRTVWRVRNTLVPDGSGMSSPGYAARGLEKHDSGPIGLQWNWVAWHFRGPPGSNFRAPAATRLGPEGSQARTAFLARLKSDEGKRAQEAGQNTSSVVPSRRSQIVCPTCPTGCSARSAIRMKSNFERTNLLRGGQDAFWRAYGSLCRAGQTGPGNK
jgi:hypothetical protein